MKNLWYIILGILLSAFFVNSSVQVRVTFDIPNVLQKNIPYSLQIEPYSQDKFPFNNFVLSFEIINPQNKDSIGIAAITSPDFKDEKFHGFSISKFTIEERIMKMQLSFHKEAYTNLFVIRFDKAVTEAEKYSFFDDKTRGIVFQRVLDMYLPYTIKMSAMPQVGEIAPEDKEAFQNHLLPSKYGMIFCEAKDALPIVTPTFLNSDILKGAKIEPGASGTNILKWRTSLSDHGKVIQCQAGEQVEHLSLTVYHYLTAIQTSPPISDSLARKSQLKCISKDGFPASKNSWKFMNGPPESWKYYQLRDNNVTLFINSSAPLHSNWSFECRGDMDMPQVAMKYLPMQEPNYPIKQIFNFTIIDSDDSVQTSQVGLAVAITIAVLLVIIAAICLIKRSKIRELLNRCTTRDHSQYECGY